MQIQQGRQTLRAARAKQHEVRMGRKFYSPGVRQGSRAALSDKGKSRGKGDPPGQAASLCARCGKNHETRFFPNKPDRPAGEAKNYEVTTEEVSEFIYGLGAGPSVPDWHPSDNRSRRPRGIRRTGWVSNKDDGINQSPGTAGSQVWSSAWRGDPQA